MAKRILIADDSAAVRSSLRAMLEDEDGRVVCAEAADGRQAIMTALQLKPDLIVLDLSMPVMNGLDAAHELKRVLRTIPIIMYTGFEGSYLQDLAFNAGVDAVVPKSAPEKLFGVVRTFLESAA